MLPLWSDYIKRLLLYFVILTLQVEPRLAGFREKPLRIVRSKTGAVVRSRPEHRISREANPFRNRSPEFSAFRHRQLNPSLSKKVNNWKKCWVIINYFAINSFPLSGVNNYKSCGFRLPLEKLMRDYHFWVSFDHFWSELG